MRGAMISTSAKLSECSPSPPHCIWVTRPPQRRQHLSSSSTSSENSSANYIINSINHISIFMQISYRMYQSYSELTQKESSTSSSSLLSNNKTHKKHVLSQKSDQSFSNSLQKNEILRKQVKIKHFVVTTNNTCSTDVILSLQPSSITDG